MNNRVYKNYVLWVLLLVMVVSVFDRFVFALALEPIKQELNLNDSQLGLMTGIAFAAFYAVAGVPIARWADRGNRVTISSVAVGLVGIMVSFCGLATNFFQILLARAGVAIGEAGAVPPAQSLLPEYFSRLERPRAMGIYFMGYPLSMIVGYLLGGWLLDALGWRTTFIVLAIPGVLVAILVKLTLKEPRLALGTVDAPKLPSLAFTFRYLWRQQSFRYVFLAFCVGNFFFMGVGQWIATFFIRSHGMSLADVGMWLALSFGVFGLFGNFLGGYYASQYVAGKEGLQMRLIALLYILNVVMSLFIYLVTNTLIALLFSAVSSFLLSLGNGPIFAAIQSLVPERMRSVAIALLFMFSNLIGFGFGPLLLGVVSDLMRPTFGDESLRYALTMFCPGGIWVAFLYWKVGISVETDIHNNSISESDSLKSKPRVSKDHTGKPECHI